MADGTIKIDTSIDSSGLEKGLKSLSSLASKGAKVAVAAVGGVATAIGGIAVAAGKVGMDFEAQMSRVQAISGATADELKRLKDQAVDLGAETAFSATEAAHGMENLASAGFSVSEIMEAMPGMLDLAASSGEDLANSADIAASTLQGFGLEASEAGHVADVLAKNAADTNAAVADTGEAMKFIAPLAHAAGISLEETAAAIGIMADNGIKGSQAGTTLRGALSRLSKPTRDMQEAMDELGISFYDSEGRMKSLSEQIDMVKAATAGMTDEQRNNYLVTLYGQEALSGMLALINTTDGKLEEMTQSYKNCDGAAEEMATTMQDNLSSALEQVGGAAESFGITVYESIQDPLKDAAFAAADAIGQITDAFKENGATGAAEAAGEVMANLLTGIAEAVPDIIDMAVAVIDAFISGIVKNADKLLKAAGEIVKALVDGLVKLLPKEIGKPLKKVFDDIGKSLQKGGLKKGIDAAIRFFEMLVKAIGQIIDVVGPALVKILDWIGENFETIIPLITGAVTAFLAYKAVTAIIDKVKAAQEALNKAVSANPYVLLATAIIGIIAALATWNSTFSPAAKAAKELSDSVDRVGDACETGGQNIANMMQEINNAESIYGNYADTLFATKEELDNMYSGIESAQEGISEIYRRESEERNGYTESEIQTLQEYYDQLQTLYQQQMEIEIAKQEAIQAAVDAEIEAFDGSVAEYQQKQATWLQTAEESKNEQIRILEEQQATEIALYQQKAEAEDISAAETQAHVEEIIDAYEKQKQGVIDRYTEMTTSVNEKYEELTGGYDDFVQQMRGINEQYEAETQYHNQTMQGYDESNYEAWRATMDEYNKAGYDDVDARWKINYAAEEEERRHSEAIADINNQLYKLLDDSNSKYVQNLIAFAGEVATNGGQITDAQAEVIQSLVAAWDSFPDDIKEKVAGYLQPAMAEMEAEYPAFKDSANMAPDEVIAAWKQLLEDNSAYDATKSTYEKAAEGGWAGIQAMAGTTQKAIDEFLGQIEKGGENAAEVASQIAPNMVAAIAGSDMYNQLSAAAKSQAAGLLEGFADLPSSTRAAMANAITPMLEELEKADPELYAAAAGTSGSVLNSIINTFGVGAPTIYTATKSGVTDQVDQAVRDGRIQNDATAMASAQGTVNATATAFTNGAPAVATAATTMANAAGTGIYSSSTLYDALAWAANVVGVPRDQFIAHMGDLQAAATQFANAGATGFTAADLAGIFGENAQAAANAANTYLAQGAGTAQTNAAAYGTAVSTGVKNANLPGALQMEATTALNAMNVAINVGANNANKAVQQMIIALRRAFQSSNLQAIAKTEGLKASQGITQGIRSGHNGAVGAANELINAAIRAIESANVYGRAYQVGANFGSGISAGIASRVSQIASQAAAAVTNAINAANAAQQAHSPARKTMPIGHNFDEGIAVGIEDMQPKVDKAAAQTMISAMDVAAKQAALAQMRAAMDNITIRTWRTKQTVNTSQTLLNSIYSDGEAIHPHGDSELVKSVQELANRPIYTDLYIDGRKFAEATAQDMTLEQQRDVRIKNMVNGVKSA
jgi:TP901 family phage tail tape measure protein